MERWVHAGGLVETAETVRKYLMAVSPVSPDVPGRDVHAMFVANHRLHMLPVVQAGVPQGVVSRYKFIERMSKPYALDLFGRQPVSQLMDPSPFLVDHRMTLDELSQAIVDADGELLVESFVITENGRYAGIGTAHSLIRELRGRRQAHLNYLAHYDHLTGLPNPRLFHDRLRQSLAHAQRSGKMVAALFVDLDKFKTVNDTMGHEAGDRLLRAAAERIADRLRKGDTVARLGGDEFGIILPDIERRQDAAIVAEKLLEAFSPAYSIGGSDLYVSCSIGIGCYPGDADEAMRLVRCADRAMYQAKECRNTYQFYSPEMRATTEGRLFSYEHLRQALKQRQFSVHYQPQVDFRTGRMYGVEALLRWQHPDLGWVSPADFIPLAEDTGLMMPIGEWVLRTACAQLRAWQAAGGPCVRMAVNISAVQFKHEGFLDLVRRIVEETGVEPCHLELEITESGLMRQAPATVATLQRIKSMGLRLSVDDFGTGYSSLSYLHAFPLDALKIDRVFVRDIAADGNGGAIARAIVSLAHSLNLHVVAEGVETEEQLRFLRREGCDAGQGFFFGRPVPGEELVARSGDIMGQRAPDCADGSLRRRTRREGAD
ncbi:MAG: EAL domain-containing protein [Nitrospirota bacterium]|nr:EAL domain-containing protein [Nitrospirota bacterium]